MTNFVPRYILLFLCGRLAFSLNAVMGFLQIYFDKIGNKHWTNPINRLNRDLKEDEMKKQMLKFAEKRYLIRQRWGFQTENGPDPGDADPTKPPDPTDPGPDDK